MVVQIVGAVSLSEESETAKQNMPFGYLGEVEIVR